ncbi:MAG TPA: C25 family cysteine peptidase [Anaerolineales bacterium]|nr:C25 family cysteine peptidase [Anaerolineales bacterium]
MSNRRRTAGLLLLGALLGLAAGLWLLRSLFAPSSHDIPGAIDLLVPADDIYAVTPADLRRFGWADVAPVDFRLENGGQPYPFHVAEDGDGYRIIFYGRGPDDPDRRYTPHNVYRLYRDGDADLNSRLIPTEETGSAAAAVTGVLVSLRLEQNALYVPALEEGRPWFWQQLAAPGEIELVLDLDQFSGGGILLTAAFYASTESGAVDPDHRLKIELNGNEIHSESWDGAGPRTIAMSIPGEILLPGENRLVIEAPGDTGVPADIVLLDWVIVEYLRAADLEGAPLHFTAIGESVDFSGTDTEPVFIFEIVETGEAAGLYILEPGAELRFSTIAGNRYAAGALGDLRAPAGLRAVEQNPDLRDHAGAAYLAIGAPELLSPLAELLDHRTAEGLSTLSVPVQAVYDQFGAGMQTPDAIRRFLSYAYENWSVRPEYVLLVGDWTYDPYGYTTEPPEFGVPSFFVHTEFGGETVSDVEFAKLDGDELPDLALGRIPARTPEQVEIVVGKTLAYETGAGGAWTRRVLAVADGSEARFSSDAAAFLDGFGDGFQPVQVNQAGDGRAVAGQIDRELTEGALIFSYFGHGSLTQLGKDGLFNTADAAALANGDRTPIMVSITCLVGLFTHPVVDSLTEVMLWNESGGVVAGLSATSLTLPAFQAFLSQALIDGIAAGPGHRLGEALLAAQRGMPTDLGRPAIEVLNTFILFGDPALVLPIQTP